MWSLSCNCTNHTPTQLNPNETLAFENYYNDHAENYHSIESNNIVSYTGNARAQSWSTYSDQRTKSNIQEIQYGLETILQLKPKSYLFHSSEYNEGGLMRIKGKNTKLEIGFIAQEVQNIIPEIVNKPHDEERDLWSMNYQKMTPVLVKVIQELVEENNELKSKLAQHEALLETLTTRLENLEQHRKN